MSEFLDPLCLTEVDDQIFQICDHPFRYQSDIAGLLAVPVGFKTDFASVPRIGVIYAMLGDCAHEPAVVHDWLYYAGLTTRAKADDVLFEAMEVIGVPAWRAFPIYWGVRLGGWYAWNDHRKKADPHNGAFKDSPNIAGQK